MELFDYLSIAAVIDDSIFCVHGGLSPSLQRIDQIRVLNRFKEVPTFGPLADIMWSDPDPDREGFQESRRFVLCEGMGDVWLIVSCWIEEQGSHLEQMWFNNF